MNERCVSFVIPAFLTSPLKAQPRSGWVFIGELGHYKLTIFWQ